MYRSPFLKAARLTNAFRAPGNYAAGYHVGEDWVPADGDRSPTLVSPTSGTIIRNTANDASYGNYIILRTTDSKVILMAHMRAKSPLAVGASVKAGDVVGTMGSTGNSTGPHLHIELENSTTWAYNRNLLKPSDYINFSNYSTSSGGGGSSSNLTVSSLTGVVYQNGSTIEPAYQTVADATNSRNRIGYLYAYEAGRCYAKTDNKYVVVYTTQTTHKVGFMNYSGKVTAARTTGITYQNGSTREPIYSTVADAKAGRSSIGSLDPWETCTCFGRISGMYLVVYTAGSTKKVGFVKYAGGVK